MKTVKFFFLTLPSNPLKMVIVMCKCPLKIQNKKLWNSKLPVLGTHDQGGREKPLFHVSLDLAWGSTQGLSEFTQRLPRSLPACSVLFLKEWAKQSWPTQSVYGDEPDFWDVEGLVPFSSVIWAVLTFRNLAQVCLGANLRSVRDSKYSLKNVCPASYYHPPNN